MAFAFPIAPTVSHFGTMTQRYVSSGFGPRSSPGGIGSTNHQGVDFPVDAGTPVLAVAKGKVAEVVADHPKAGTYITLDHGNGYWSRYLHLSETSVVPGQSVRVGTRLGASGGVPGAWGAGTSTGPHLHFELWDGEPFRGGVPLDPLPLLTREATAFVRQYGWALAAGGVSIAGLALAWLYRDNLRNMLRGD